MKFKHHVFVCTNQRPKGHPRGCCGEKQSEEILKALKLETAQLKLDKPIRIQSAGCLNSCEKGPVIVIYPEGIWYGGVQISDVKEIVQTHLIENKIVDRLKFD